MGTRSDIIVKRQDGKYARIYCHWDGYVSHNGKILFEHYGTQAKAEALVFGGDLSSLSEKCTKPKGHSFNSVVPGHCVYYGRDRGEKGTEAQVFSTLRAAWPQDSGTEFTYVWQDGKWLVGDPDADASSLVDLGWVLQDIKNREPRTAIKAFGGNFVIGHRGGGIQPPRRGAGKPSDNVPPEDRMTSLQMVENARNGRIFTVEFIKRTNGELRRMVCRRGVRKNLKGTGMAYDPLSKALLTVWDVQKGAYRMINLEQLVALRMGKREFRWNGRRFERIG